jgi:membrane protease YdiL (CAAX protease family)
VWAISHGTFDNAFPVDLLMIIIGKFSWLWILIVCMGIFIDLWLLFKFQKPLNSNTLTFNLRWIFWGVASAGEEFIVRGPLLLISHYYSAAAAYFMIIPVSICWAVGHLTNGWPSKITIDDVQYLIILVTIAGVIYGISVLISNSLIPAIIIHAAYNCYICGKTFGPFKSLYFLNKF